MSLANRWHLRRVAEASSRACYICYKPTTSVLITPDSRDFFYVCNGHLTDKGFCSPIIDEAAAKRAADEARQREIEAVKKEYEEKQRKKEEKKKQKEKGKEKGKSKEENKDEKMDETAAAKKDDKDTTPAEPTPSQKADEPPRVFTLHKNFYQMRVDRLRNADLAKRTRERLKNPSAFPSVPSGDP
ncbi:MAG: hypothetical protein M1832_000080 [Thelocarpon impressellum]|nr:MAG: hypothetical protein M1832_000080 [Thelocarpon impressellum]